MGKPGRRPLRDRRCGRGFTCVPHTSTSHSTTHQKWVMHPGAGGSTGLVCPFTLTWLSIAAVAALATASAAAVAALPLISGATGQSPTPLPALERDARVLDRRELSSTASLSPGVVLGGNAAALPPASVLEGTAGAAAAPLPPTVTQAEPSSGAVDAAALSMLSHPPPAFASARDRGSPSPVVLTVGPLGTTSPSLDRRDRSMLREGTTKSLTQYCDDRVASVSWLRRQMLRMACMWAGGAVAACQPSGGALAQAVTRDVTAQ